MSDVQYNSQIDVYTAFGYKISGEFLRQNYESWDWILRSETREDLERNIRESATKAGCTVEFSVSERGREAWFTYVNTHS